MERGTFMDLLSARLWVISSRWFIRALKIRVFEATNKLTSGVSKPYKEEPHLRRKLSDVSISRSWTSKNLRIAQICSCLSGKVLVWPCTCRSGGGEGGTSVVWLHHSDFCDYRQAASAKKNAKKDLIFDRFDTFDFFCSSVVAMIHFPFWHFELGVFLLFTERIWRIKTVRQPRSQVVPSQSCHWPRASWSSPPCKWSECWRSCSEHWFGKTGRVFSSREVFSRLIPSEMFGCHRFVLFSIFFCSNRLKSVSCLLPKDCLESWSRFCTCFPSAKQ